MKGFILKGSCAAVMACALLASGVIIAFGQTYPSDTTTTIATSTSSCTVNGQPVPCGQLFKSIGWFAGIGLGLIILFIVISILCFIFWIFMLVDAIKKPIQHKPLWIIIILLFSLVGAIVYYFAVKRSADPLVSGNIQKNNIATPDSTSPPASQI
jgi:4-amino-4-deoxy-L-arabinose transferase-like glycosyltransferase